MEDFDPIYRASQEGMWASLAPPVKQSPAWRSRQSLA
jgi:hypothetical protein